MPRYQLYTDGSFDKESEVYGCGFALVKDGICISTHTKAYCNAFSAHRNVAGEVLAVMLGIEYCFKLGIKELEIIYDYTGIGNWALGIWNAKKPLTQMYKRFILSYTNHMSLKFTNIKGHTGVEYNELADKLASKSIKEFKGEVSYENNN